MLSNAIVEIATRIIAVEVASSTQVGLSSQPASQSIYTVLVIEGSEP